MHLRDVLDYVGGTLTEHSEGGWVIYLSPRLRMRLKEYTGKYFDSSTRVYWEDIQEGTQLTRALIGMYNNEKGA